MTDAQTAAADRLKDAIKGKDPAAYCKVFVADVQAVGQSVANPTEAVAGVTGGAANAVKKFSAERAVGRVVYQQAGALAALLGAAGANAQ